MEPFPVFRASVFEIVQAIPRGRVMTYGAVAAMIPAPPGIDGLAYRRIRARWVGYALAGCPDTLPWQRVVNARGQVAARAGHGPHIQRQLLEQEGVALDAAGHLDLDRHTWEPVAAWRAAHGLL
jgi:methylated-DNA-protein-cysteine methyltransferase related protein